MSPLRRAGALAWKDVTVELRRKESLNSMLFFGAVVLMIFQFALGPGPERIQAAAAGLLWLAFVFTGVLGLARSFQVEQEDGCLDELLLAPGGREALFLGKLLGNLAFLLVVEVLILPLFGILYNLDLWAALPALILVVVLASLGLATLGTLLSAMTVHMRAREVMLPLLLFPLAVPVLLGAVAASQSALAGEAMGTALPWLKLLGGFDVLFLTASLLAFDAVVAD